MYVIWTVYRGSQHKPVPENAMRHGPLKSGSRKERKSEAPTSDDEIMKLVEHGHWSEALEMMTKMQESTTSPTPASFYNTIICLLTEHSQWELALAVFDRAFGPTGQSPDASSFEAAISACVQGWQWQRAHDLLAALEGRCSVYYSAYLLY
jgi:pentatricopeptide repeat protein